MKKPIKIIKRQNNIHLISYSEYAPEHYWGVADNKQIKKIVVKHYMHGGTLEGEQLQIIQNEK